MGVVPSFPKCKSFFVFTVQKCAVEADVCTEYLILWIWRLLLSNCWHFVISRLLKVILGWFGHLDFDLTVHRFVCSRRLFNEFHGRLSLLYIHM